MMLCKFNDYESNTTNINNNNDDDRTSNAFVLWPLLSANSISVSILRFKPLQKALHPSFRAYLPNTRMTIQVHVCVCVWVLVYIV